MASTFQLTAQIVLAGPDTRPALAKLKRAFGNVTIPIKFDKLKYRRDLSTMKQQLRTAMTVPVKLSLRDARMQVTKIKRDLKDRLGKTRFPIKLTISKGAETNLDRVSKKLLAVGDAALKAKGNVDQLGLSLKALGTGSYKIVAASQLTKGLNNAGKAASNTKKKLKEVTDAAADFGRVSGLAIRRYAGFTIATTAIFTLGRAITSATKNAVDFEREMIKISQISGAAVGSMGHLEKQILKLSTAYGINNAQLIEVSKTLAQAGLSARDTAMAMKAIAKTDLAPTFSDMKKTTEGAVAVLNQFGTVAGKGVPISAKNLEKALGSINAVSKKFAVESDDIISAVRRVGGVFVAASTDIKNASGEYVSGLTKLQQFVAIFTSVRATTRETAETVATGLRTIFTRIQRGRTINMLKDLGVNLRDAEGRFVGTYKAVEILGDKLNKLNPRDPIFAKIAEELGGFRQIGKTIPLLMQAERRMKALKVAEEGVNSLNADTKKSLQGLGRQFATVREEFNQMIVRFTQSGTFKSMADTILSLARSFISLADALRDLAPLMAVMGVMRGFSIARAIMPGIKPGLMGQSAPILKRKEGGPTLAPGKVTQGVRSRDSVLAVAKGEYVIRSSAVNSETEPILQAINSGQIQFAFKGSPKDRNGNVIAPQNSIRQDKGGYRDMSTGQYVSPEKYQKNQREWKRYDETLRRDRLKKQSARITSGNQPVSYNQAGRAVDPKSGQFLPQRTKEVQNRLQTNRQKNARRAATYAARKEVIIKKRAARIGQTGSRSWMPKYTGTGLPKGAGGPMMAMGAMMAAPQIEKMIGEGSQAGSATSGAIMGGYAASMMGLGPIGTAAGVGLGAVSSMSAARTRELETKADDQLSKATTKLADAFNKLAKDGPENVLKALEKLNEGLASSTEAVVANSGGMIGWFNNLTGNKTVTATSAGRNRIGSNGAGALMADAGAMKQEGMMLYMLRNLSIGSGNKEAQKLRTASTETGEIQFLSTIQQNALARSESLDAANIKGMGGMQADYRKRYWDTDIGRSSAIGTAQAHLNLNNDFELERAGEIAQLQLESTQALASGDKGRAKSLMRDATNLAVVTLKASEYSNALIENAAATDKMNKAMFEVTSETNILIDVFGNLEDGFRNIGNIGLKQADIIDNTFARMGGVMGGKISRVNSFKNPNAYNQEQMRGNTSDLLKFTGSTPQMAKASKEFLAAEDIRRRMPGLLSKQGIGNKLAGSTNALDDFVTMLDTEFKGIGKPMRDRMVKIIEAEFTGDEKDMKFGSMSHDEMLELTEKLYSTLGEASRKALEAARDAEIKILTTYTNNLNRVAQTRIQVEEEYADAILANINRPAAFRRMVNEERDTLANVAMRRKAKADSLVGGKNVTAVGIVANMRAMVDEIARKGDTPEDIKAISLLNKSLLEHKKALDVLGSRTADLALIEEKLAKEKEKKNAAGSTLRDLATMDWGGKRKILGDLANLKNLKEGVNLGGMQLKSAVAGYEYLDKTGLMTDEQADSLGVMVHKAIIKASGISMADLGVFAPALKGRGEKTKEEQTLVLQFAQAVKESLSVAKLKFDFSGTELTSIDKNIEAMLKLQQASVNATAKGKRAGYGGTTPKKYVSSADYSGRSTRPTYDSAVGPVTMYHSNPHDRSSRRITSTGSKLPPPTKITKTAPSPPRGFYDPNRTWAEWWAEVDANARSTSPYGGMASGGPIRGPGTGTSDSVPINASNGEYMVNAKAASIPENRRALDAMNYAKGGPIKRQSEQSSVGSRYVDFNQNTPETIKKERNAGVIATARNSNLHPLIPGLSGLTSKEMVISENDKLDRYDYDYENRSVIDAGYSAPLIPGLSGINATNREMLSPNTRKPTKFAGLNSGKLAEASQAPRGLDKTTGRITGSNLSEADKKHNSTIAGMEDRSKLFRAEEARKKEARRKALMQEKVDRAVGIYKGTSRNETATAFAGRTDPRTRGGNVTDSDEGAGKLITYGKPAYTPDDAAAGRKWFQGAGSQRQSGPSKVSRQHGSKYDVVDALGLSNPEKRREQEKKAVAQRNAKRLEEARRRNGKSATAPTITRTARTPQTPEERAAKVDAVRRRNAEKIAKSRGVSVEQVLAEQQKRRDKASSTPTPDGFNVTSDVLADPVVRKPGARNTRRRGGAGVSRYPDARKPGAPHVTRPGVTPAGGTTPVAPAGADSARIGGPESLVAAAPGVAGGRTDVRRARVPGNGGGGGDGGGNVNGGGELAGVPALTESIDTLNTSITTLNNTMSSLSETSIELTATHTVNVNLNGAKTLTAIEPQLKTMAIEAVEKGIAARIKPDGETTPVPGGSSTSSLMS